MQPGSMSGDKGSSSGPAPNLGRGILDGTNPPALRVGAGNGASAGARPATEQCSQLATLACDDTIHDGRRSSLTGPQRKFGKIRWQ
jgi:hypothetical protein